MARDYFNFNVNARIITIEFNDVLDKIHIILNSVPSNY